MHMQIIYTGHLQNQEKNGTKQNQSVLQNSDVLSS